MTRALLLFPLLAGCTPVAAPPVFDEMATVDGDHILVQFIGDDGAAVGQIGRAVIRPDDRITCATRSPVPVLVPTAPAPPDLVVSTEAPGLYQALADLIVSEAAEAPMPPTDGNDFALLREGDRLWVIDGRVRPEIRGLFGTLSEEIAGEILVRAEEPCLIFG